MTVKNRLDSRLERRGFEKKTFFFEIWGLESTLTVCSLFYVLGCGPTDSELRPMRKLKMYKPPFCSERQAFGPYFCGPTARLKYNIKG